LASQSSSFGFTKQIPHWSFDHERAVQPLLEDKTYLRHFWHPVCTVAEFERANASGHGPMAITLLGESIVLARLNGKLVAASDRCAHRSAKLSWQGEQARRKDFLACPYHGWQYDNEGICKLVPACPEKAIPPRAKLNAYSASEILDRMGTSRQ
jgi:vanillate O-demethylase monooxygenase subunit